MRNERRRGDATILLCGLRFQGNPSEFFPAPMSSEQNYSLEQNGAVRGSYTFEQIVTMWQRKELSLKDRVRKEGTEQWTEIEKLVHVLDKADHSAQPQSHGCLTMWLSLMILGSVIGMVTVGIAIRDLHHMSMELIAAIIYSIATLISAVGLFRWRKWGFWGCVATAVFVTLLNLAHDADLRQLFSGVGGVLVLSILLQLKAGGRTGWQSLK